MSAPKPTNEEERLLNLIKYQILDTNQETAFDEIVELASTICDTPVSQVSLIDKNRLFYKADIGTGLRESPREDGFCSHTILQNDILEIEDLSLDSRFSDNPYVKGEAKVRFYAGVTLKSKEGYSLGALCIIDTKPKKLSDKQKRALKILGNRVINLIELGLELKKTKEHEELQQQDIEFKDKFISILSHDLRSPLNSIKSTIELYTTHGLDKVELDEIMHQLKHSVDSTTILIDNLLQWAKSNLDYFKPTFTTFTASEVITETVSLYKSVAKQKGINLSYLGDDQAEIYGNKEMIKLIVRNLVNNAVKFCKDKDSITITSSLKNKKIIISVEDTGVGMPQEYLSQLLENNNSESSLGTAKEKGLGLGFILINEFINLNNGTLTASSQVNQGTTFRVSLPISN